MNIISTKLEKTVLGIDLGFAIIGYGVIRYHIYYFYVRYITHGNIQTPKIKFENRLQIINDKFKEILFYSQPNMVFLESIFYNSNAKSVSFVNQTLGVLKLILFNHKINFFEISPLQTKKICGCIKTKNKNYIITSLIKIFNIKNSKKSKKDDAYDALGIALAGIFINSKNTNV